ncbi:unnamed protein product, partial [Meganyctiphanes norvegica]
MLVQDTEGTAGPVLGVSGHLVCQVLSAPQPVFTWTTSNGSVLSPQHDYAVHEPKLVDGLTLWESLLEVKALGISERTYRCTATNTLGAATTTLELALPMPSPYSLQVHNVTLTSVAMSWIANETNPAPLAFTIRYHPVYTNKYKFVEIPVSDNGTGKIYGKVVRGLTPGIRYSFTVAARAHQRASHYADPPLIVTTDGMTVIPSGRLGKDIPPEDFRDHHSDTMPPDTSHVHIGQNHRGTGIAGIGTSRLLLLLTALSGLLLLAINGIILACFLKHRKTRQEKDASKPARVVITPDGSFDDLPP